MKYTLFLALIVLIVGCNPQKQLAKEKAKTDKANYKAQEQLRGHLDAAAILCAELFAAKGTIDSTEYKGWIASYNELIRLHDEQISAYTWKMDSLGFELDSLKELPADSGSCDKIVKQQDKIISQAKGTIAAQETKIKKLQDQVAKIPPVQETKPDEAKLKLAQKENEDLRAVNNQQAKSLADCLKTRAESDTKGKVVLDWWWFALLCAALVGTIILLFKR